MSNKKILKQVFGRWAGPSSFDLEKSSFQQGSSFSSAPGSFSQASHFDIQVTPKEHRMIEERIFGGKFNENLYSEEEKKFYGNKAQLELMDNVAKRAKAEGIADEVIEKEKAAMKSEIDATLAEQKELESKLPKMSRKKKVAIEKKVKKGNKLAMKEADREIAHMKEKDEHLKRTKKAREVATPAPKPSSAKFDPTASTPAKSPAKAPIPTDKELEALKISDDEAEPKEEKTDEKDKKVVPEYKGIMKPGEKIEVGKLTINLSDAEGNLSEDAVFAIGEQAGFKIKTSAEGRRSFSSAKIGKRMRDEIVETYKSSKGDHISISKGNDSLEFFLKK